MIELQITRAQRHRFRDALRNDAGFQPAQACQREASSVVRVESFCLDDVVADDGVPAAVSLGLSGMLGLLLHTGGRGKQKNRAVRQDAINVEQDELDFLSAGVGHEVYSSQFTVPELQIAD